MIIIPLIKQKFDELFKATATTYIAIAQHDASNVGRDLVQCFCAPQTDSFCTAMIG